MEGEMFLGGLFDNFESRLRFCGLEKQESTDKGDGMKSCLRFVASLEEVDTDKARPIANGVSKFVATSEEVGADEAMPIRGDAALEEAAFEASEAVILPAVDRVRSLAADAEVKTGDSGIFIDAVEDVSFEASGT